MVALDTLATLLRAGVRSELLLVGDGPLAPVLHQRVQADGLPVQFLGHLTDRARLARLVAAADVCISPDRGRRSASVCLSRWPVEPRSW
jgi:alpha-1,6-mannosyltransferase